MAVGGDEDAAAGGGYGAALEVEVAGAFGCGFNVGDGVGAVGLGQVGCVVEVVVVEFGNRGFGKFIAVGGVDHFHVPARGVCRGGPDDYPLGAAHVEGGVGGVAGFGGGEHGVARFAAADGVFAGFVGAVGHGNEGFNGGGCVADEFVVLLVDKHELAVGAARGGG